MRELIEKALFYRNGIPCIGMVGTWTGLAKLDRIRYFFTVTVIIDQI